MTSNTPELNNLIDVDREIKEAENLQEVLQAKIDAFAIQTGIGVVKEQLICLKQIKEECIKQAAPILFSKEKNYSESGVRWAISVGTEKARLKKGVKASALPKNLVRVKEEPDLIKLRKALKNPATAEELAELAYLEEGSIKITYKMEKE